jgi:hypothetical protein
MEKLEEMAADLARVEGLLTGADALLRRKSYLEDVPVDAGDALRELVTESQAMVAGVKATVDEMVEAADKARRNIHAAQVSKHIGGAR